MNENRDKNTQDPPIEAANTTAKCTLVTCIGDEDQNRLICRSYQRMVHYECTQLPLYQLQIFANTYNNQYVCHNCVRITRSLRSKIGENKYHMMQEQIAKKDNEIKKLKKQLTKNREVINNDIETMLTQKMSDLEAKTRKMIKEEIQQTKDFMKGSSRKTYADITKAHKENLKSVVAEQKEEERREKRDIESRRKNIIIHGLCEQAEDTKEEDQEEDKKEIEDLLKDIGIRDIKPTHQHRIGFEHEKSKKNRPIKVTLQSEEEKERIMSNLKALKKFGYHLSITDDFTINERRKIKEMCEKAKKMELRM
ncbi:uncharacterized protein PF3D7_1120000-like [Clytia hemisphaerica]|uniref:uncharacterized protein PF3D7_1120000-like n=1 Tax=Clytia hemisphaerica TaxID=252671 RepID=UPI0034D5B755